MIQDIYPKKLYNQYRPDISTDPDGCVISANGFQILVRVTESQEVALPTVRECGLDRGYTYLFAVDDQLYYRANDETGIAEALTGYTYMNMRNMRQHANVSLSTIFAVYTGKHLLDWYRDNRFCGRCGHEMSHSLTERAMVCPDCHYTAYPRIMPAVIVGVIDQENDKILITRYRVGYSHNALIAGFTEIGESVEETVAREVMEEAGVRVKNIRYYKSQPWGVANDILLGYYCDLDGDPTIHMDNEELKLARWTSREELELQPDNISLTNEMMMMFKQGKKI